MQKLTERQLEIAREISQGYTYEEIGSHLGLSPSTVKAHTNIIKLKLGITHKRHIPRILKELGIL